MSASSVKFILGSIAVEYPGCFLPLRCILAAAKQNRQKKMVLNDMLVVFSGP
jgi:hypothetical protein